MTREEATIQSLMGHIEALEETIKALEQEPCEDAVSRQEVLKGYVEIERTDGVEIYSEKAVPTEYINNLPPVTPTRKKGRWITFEDDWGDITEAVCSCCNANGHHKFRFCPHCGAEMDNDG